MTNKEYLETIREYWIKHVKNKPIKDIK